MSRRTQYLWSRPEYKAGGNFRAELLRHRRTEWERAEAARQAREQARHAINLVGDTELACAQLLAERNQQRLKRAQRKAEQKAHAVATKERWRLLSKEARAQRKAAKQLEAAKQREFAKAKRAALLAQRKAVAEQKRKQQIEQRAAFKAAADAAERDYEQRRKSENSREWRRLREQVRRSNKCYGTKPYTATHWTASSAACRQQAYSGWDRE